MRTGEEALFSPLREARHWLQLGRITLLPGLSQGPSREPLEVEEGIGLQSCLPSLLLRVGMALVGSSIPCAGPWLRLVLLAQLQSQPTMWWPKG